MWPKCRTIRQTDYCDPWNKSRIVCNVLAKVMPVLAEPSLWDALVGAARQAFKADEGVNHEVVSRYRPN
jgi:hypothetical protein